MDVWEEQDENDTRFGKTEDDQQVIFDQARGFIRRRRQQKRARSADRMM